MNYIYIVNLGNNKYSKYCIDSWKIWGRRYNIEVIEYNVDANPSIEPHWMKVFATQVLQESDIEFDKIAIVVYRIDLECAETPDIFLSL